MEVEPDVPSGWFVIKQDQHAGTARSTGRRVRQRAVSSQPVATAATATGLMTSVNVSRSAWSRAVSIA